MKLTKLLFNSGVWFVFLPVWVVFPVTQACAEVPASSTIGESPSEISEYLALWEVNKGKQEALIKPYLDIKKKKSAASAALKQLELLDTALKGYISVKTAVPPAKELEVRRATDVYIKQCSAYRAALGKLLGSKSSLYKSLAAVLAESQAAAATALKNMR